MKKSTCFRCKTGAFKDYFSMLEKSNDYIAVADKGGVP